MKPHLHYIMTIFLLCSATFLGTGCGEKAKNKNTDKNIEAYRLIDEQRTDEAITLLESALDEEPQNVALQSTLASAYAHKAGIRIQNLVPAISQSDKLRKLGEKMPTVEQELSAGKKINANAMNLALLLNRFAGVFEAYSAIPVIEKENAAYLEHAIGLLNNMGKDAAHEDILYRAVLEIVFFKYVLAEDLIGDFSSKQAIESSQCQINLGHLNSSILRLGKLLLDIYSDIAIVNPKQSGDLRTLSKSAADIVSNLTLTTTGLGLLDEASQIFLKRTIAFSGFGKIIQCRSQ